MDENEVRAICKKIQEEETQAQKDRDTYIPESHRVYQYKWLRDHIVFIKGLRKKIIYTIFAVSITTAGSIYVVNYQETKRDSHAHAHEKSNITE